MSAAACLGLSWLCAAAVWQGTGRRLGTTDELRTLGGAIMGFLLWTTMAVVGVGA